jgi:hypothetical protein
MRCNLYNCPSWEIIETASSLAGKKIETFTQSLLDGVAVSVRLKLDYLFQPILSLVYWQYRANYRSGVSGRKHGR